MARVIFTNIDSTVHTVFENDFKKIDVHLIWFENNSVLQLCDLIFLKINHKSLVRLLLLLLLSFYYQSQCVVDKTRADRLKPLLIICRQSHK